MSYLFSIALFFLLAAFLPGKQLSPLSARLLCLPSVPSTLTAAPSSSFLLVLLASLQ